MNNEAKLIFKSYKGIRGNFYTANNTIDHGNPDSPKETRDDTKDFSNIFGTNVLASSLPHSKPQSSMSKD